VERASRCWSKRSTASMIVVHDNYVTLHTRLGDCTLPPTMEKQVLEGVSWLEACRLHSLSSHARGTKRSVSSCAKPAARSIWLMIGNNALSVCCGEQKYRKRV
jgi:hypothetical protein